MTKTHLIEDQTIGGLKREYVEVDRKADVGDYVLIVDAAYTGGTYANGDILAVSAQYNDAGGVYCKDVACRENYGGQIDGEEYVTLEPTDIVHHADQRYRLVDRNALVGEKVVITDSSDYPLGTVTECESICEDFDDGSIFVTCKIDPVINGYIDGDMEKYYVLVPVESEITSDGCVTYLSCDKPIEVTADQASPQVIDMLANLAQRIVDLEHRVSGLTTTIERHEHVNDRLNDEIDTLHTNQKRLGEELASINVKTPFDADEVIVELAKLLAEAHRRGGRQ